jgi:hypothetical protein
MANYMKNMDLMLLLLVEYYNECVVFIITKWPLFVVHDRGWCALCTLYDNMTMFSVITLPNNKVISFTWWWWWHKWQVKLSRLWYKKKRTNQSCTDPSVLYNEMIWWRANKGFVQLCACRLFGQKCDNLERLLSFWPVYLDYLRRLRCTISWSGFVSAWKALCTRQPARVRNCTKYAFNDHQRLRQSCSLSQKKSREAIVDGKRYLARICTMCRTLNS